MLVDIWGYAGICACPLLGIGGSFGWILRKETMATLEPYYWYTSTNGGNCWTLTISLPKDEPPKELMTKEHIKRFAWLRSKI
jgi:hypothetical protein